MLDLEGKSMPCFVQNYMFKHCLLKKFDKKEIKTKITSNLRKGILIHIYSQVYVNGKWVDVDVYEKKRGLPFGKNIHNFNFK
jgi:hypothetical protein